MTDPSARFPSDPAADPRAEAGEPRPDRHGPHEPARRLIEALVCPASGGPLEWDREAGELVSRAAGLAYPIRSGIPIMLIDEARHLDG